MTLLVEFYKKNILGGVNNLHIVYAILYKYIEKQMKFNNNLSKRKSQKKVASRNFLFSVKKINNNKENTSKLGDSMDLTVKWNKQCITKCA